MESPPKFRVDLTVHYQSDSGGKRRVVLKDPISEKYFRLSEYEFNLLRTLDGAITVEQAVEKLKRAGHHYSLEDARAITVKAAELGLVLGTKFGSSVFQRSLKSRMEQAKRARYLSSVYFLFIPLVDPDRFLTRTLWLFELVANRFTGLLAALAAPGALYLIISGIPRIQTEYLFFFNWWNLLYLWITIAVTKLVHEFSHAYMAKRYGLHVPEMGLAFLIFFPCLYCNTTDAWQLADRKQRIAISAAGIIAEGVVAVISTYVWYFSQPGIVNSLAFYLMAVSFLSTVIFNGNPLLKFDGYFVLADLLDMPNLSPNSLKYVKYLFLNVVMGNSLVPNPAQTNRDTFIFTIYGISAFVYRIVLYTSIVVGVYFRFDKVLGILLALLAMGLFIFRPLWLGVKSLYRSRREIRPRPSGLIVLAAIVAVASVPLMIPWSSRSVYPCFMGSAKVRKLTVPLHTLVKKVYIRDGSVVNEGDILFQLDTTGLALKLRQQVIRRAIIRKEIQLLLLDEKSIGEAGGKEIELQQVEDEIELLKDQFELAQSSITAPFDGVVTNLDYRLQEGFQPGEGVVVGETQSPEDCIVHALIPAADVHKVVRGQQVEILFPVGSGRILRKRIDSIRSYGERDLRNSPFSSRFGGELATEVRGEKQKDAPLEAQYDCSIHIDNRRDPIRLGMTGRMAVSSAPGSVVTRLFDSVFRIFNRESFL